MMELVFEEKEIGELLLSIGCVRTQQERGHLQTRKRRLTRVDHWHTGFRLSSLQNCEK